MTETRASLTPFAAMTGNQTNPIPEHQARPFIALWTDYANAVPIEQLRQNWRAGKYDGCPADLAGDLVRP